ncbi:hypothetical protein BC938DRAFT_482912 [Jimgerdemannia flammicorona]|uniref:Uncharacterized protein n=1 Tax=Jimgerdemannia flammicorona TaxID=994334 RepID=A0A433R0A5_9FUNG|nr:hypothetical protein BC938DRAFT_482912 [Jimgerdemannia flammicorona]
MAPQPMKLKPTVAHAPAMVATSLDGIGGLRGLVVEFIGWTRGQVGVGEVGNPEYGMVPPICILFYFTMYT